MLQIGDGGQTGTGTPGTGPVVNNAILDFDRSNNYQVNNAITNNDEIDNVSATSGSILTLSNVEGDQTIVNKDGGTMDLTSPEYDNAWIENDNGILTITGIVTSCTLYEHSSGNFTVGQTANECSMLNDGTGTLAIVGNTIGDTTSGCDITTNNSSRRDQFGRQQQLLPRPSVA